MYCIVLFLSLTSRCQIQITPNDMESNIKLIALMFFGLVSCLIYGNDPVDTVADLLHNLVEGL